MSINIDTTENLKEKCMIYGSRYSNILPVFKLYCIVLHKKNLYQNLSIKMIVCTNFT